MIYQTCDKNNPNVSRRVMGRFRRAIDDLELRELPLHGRRYTWSNERESSTLERMDRVFCSVDWEAGHPNCFLTCTATLMSDHCPLLLHTELSSPQHRCFHFESFCPRYPDSKKPFKRLGLNRAWQPYHHPGSQTKEPGPEVKILERHESGQYQAADRMGKRTYPPL
jgi:hypothetical protein